VLTLLVGGVRSGKSSLAVAIGRRHPGPVVFLATAQPFDDELALRVQRHRDERPPHWLTVEEPVELAAAIEGAADDALLVVDCLTVWMGNLAHHQPLQHLRDDAARDVVAALAARRGSTVVVSNEVGMGIVPEHASGRDYRDELGRLNQAVASIAGRTLFLVAGRALPLDDPWTFLGGNG